MRNLLFLIVFIIYATSIFCVSNPFLILSFAIINLLLAICFKVPLKRMTINLYKFTSVVLITFIFNFLFGNLKDALLIAIRLYIVCNITFIFTYTMGYSNIINSIELLFLPLKFIGISPSDLSLIINIAMTSIPVFLREYDQISLSLNSKGLKKNSIKNVKYSLKLILISVFKKTNELELTLKSKNYVEN